MNIVNRGESIILFLGDIVFLMAALWMTLLVRYFEIPTLEIWTKHLVPFSILFIVWIVILFIAGLYERRTTFMKNILPQTIFRVQLINSIIAVLFFYFIPYFVITPKTNLFIYLIISFGILLVWRIYLADLISPQSKNEALLIGRGDEMKDLREEINKGSYGFVINHSINLEKVDSIDVKNDIIDPVYSNSVSTIIIDTKDDAVLPLLPHFYNLMFSNIQFVDAHDTYENLFNRIPVSLVRHGWFLENVKTKPHMMYDALKRITDIILAIFMGLISLIFYPFVLIAIKIDDGGSVFYTDKRIGQDNRIINVYKFRSMSENVDPETNSKHETRIGKFIRKTRIDELPQLWNVIRGDLSLIGPRPEQPKIVDNYKEQVPYYNVRHLIKPGLSGWAQIYHDNHPHHGVDVEATKDKLSYDLYYIKNRSFFLDLKIILKTLKTLLLSKGR
jgi:exopolysaccharide biosynthesis polyprenyl glycosylphosphotransferase